MNSSTPINPFTVDLRHSLRPNCQCESCTRTRILAMKDGYILVAHLDRLNEQCHAAMKQKETESRRIVTAATSHMDQLVTAASPRLAEGSSSNAPEIVTATNILRISPS